MNQMNGSNTLSTVRDQLAKIPKDSSGHDRQCKAADEFIQAHGDIDAGFTALELAPEFRAHPGRAGDEERLHIAKVHRELPDQEQDGKRNEAAEQSQMPFDQASHRFGLQLLIWLSMSWTETVRA